MSTKILDSNLSRQQFLRSGAFAMLALAASSSVVRAATEPVKVGFIVPDYEEMRWKAADQLFFEQEAKAVGINAFVQSSNNSEAQQTSQVENMLTLGIKVLVLTPVNVRAASVLVMRARKAGVEVIDYNFLIPDADISLFIGRDAIEIGERIATAAVAARPKGNYILVLGDEGMSVAVDTAKGNLNVIKPLVDSGAIKIVSQRYNKAWSTDLARSQVENALTQVNNDVAAVLCSNDGMAYGAIQALQAQGLAGKVFVSGVDCEPRAQQLIRDGLLTVSNFSAFDMMGKEAARAALALGTGAPLKVTDTITTAGKKVPWIKAPNFNVTKDNIEQNTADHGWWFAKS